MAKKAAVIIPQTREILAQMGEQIRLARLRRKLTVGIGGGRKHAGISRATLISIEKGTPTVSIGSYAAVLHALNNMDSNLLLIAKDDEFGRKLQDLGAAHQTAGAQERRVANGAGQKTIYVYENWRGEAPTLLGRLRCGFVRGQETFSFEYDPAWLSSAESSFSLDPDLALYRGRQYVPLNHKQLFWPVFRLLPGSLGDAC